MDLLSPADQERLRGLRFMKGVALGALVLMAVIFVVAFALEEQYPWLAYVRAAAEGGMVGALAANGAELAPLLGDLLAIRGDLGR